MTEARQPASENPQRAGEIAALLASAPTVAEAELSVAAAVLVMLPPPLLSLQKGQLAAEIAQEIAGFVVIEIPQRPGEAGQSPFGQSPFGDAEALADWLEELTYRGLYTLSAARRLGSAVLKPETREKERAKALKSALDSEKRNFGRHLDSAKQRERGRERMRDARRRYGDVLSWHHLGTAKTHRPSHLKAAGKNFHADRVPKLTGVFPGMKPGCDCVPGAPILGADMLI